jgi:nucleoside-diphosphate-sugar epimerase
MKVNKLCAPVFYMVDPVTYIYRAPLQSAMNLIITGAAGEVGMNLCLLLKGKGYSITAIDKNKRNLDLLKKLCPYVRAVHADLSQKGSWTKLFKTADVVVQLQAQISSPLEKPYLRNNVTSVRNVVAVCEQYNIKSLIHASSSVVISVAKDQYTTTKRQGEEIVRQAKVPHIILRPVLMYGCFDIKHLGYLRTFFRYRLFPMPGNGRYLRQPIFVEDFCRIIISCIERAPDNKVYDIAGKEQWYLIDMLKLLAEEEKKRVLFVPIPLPLFNLMIRVYGFVNRSTRIIPDQLTALTAGDIFPVIDWEKIFGVKYTPFKAGVRKMVSSKHYALASQMIRLDE